MSPLGRSGGSQDIMIFELDAGIALMACGAEGTAFHNCDCTNKCTNIYIDIYMWYMNKCIYQQMGVCTVLHGNCQRGNDNESRWLARIWDGQDGLEGLDGLAGQEGIGGVPHLVCVH